MTRGGAGHVTGVDATRADTILDEVAAGHGVTAAQILGRTVRRDVVAARDAVIRRLRDDLQMTMPAIGKLLGRDHTSILYSLRKTGGTALPELDPQCAVSGCGRPRRSSDGWCQAHLDRVRAHGDPIADIPIGQMRGQPFRTFEACEVCEVPTVGGSRWCGIGGCRQTQRDGGWSWSREVAS